jgi:type IV pilus assembly protein PilC
MGLFPTRILAQNDRRPRKAAGSMMQRRRPLTIPWIGGRVKSGVLTSFTRQLATLVESGLPLLRGLRLLHEQETHPRLKQIIADMAFAIEGGSSFGEALAMHPRVFDRLYVNMVKAGEVSGALEITLRRLADFMEKARRIKGKVKAAMFYPSAVLVIATGVLSLMMFFIVPRFQAVLEGLTNGGRLPAFTEFVISLSALVRTHALQVAMAIAALGVLFLFVRSTAWGRWALDGFKLRVPIVGPIFRKLSISRFTRTLGTLIGSGVPILQALTIVKETTGNVVVSRVVGTVHEKVKEGEPIAPTLKASGIFPAMVAGMVDVGEQTGALPDMLMKVADTYDEEADNSVSAMTSLLEPFMLVFLAVIVGSIVIALFLPLINFNPDGPVDRTE